MTDSTDKKERIAKRMARAGLCSRRDAEKWIIDGRVTVNGVKLESPAFTVSPTDSIIVDGNALPKLERPRLWRYHKPAGLVTSHKDEKERDTVFDKLPDDMPRVISVGRLDLNSEGLLLLTNDGELARKLELPSTGWKRKYRVRVHGHPRASDLTKLGKGLTIEGIRYDAIEATLDSSKGANSWLTISLREGKNREIRRVMEYLGYTVLRLIRISYGPLQLGELETGHVEEVKSKILREQMGVAKFEEEPEPEEPRGRGRGKLQLKQKGAPRGGKPAAPKADAKPAEKPTGNRKFGRNSAEKPAGNRKPGRKPASSSAPTRSRRR